MKYALIDGQRCEAQPNLAGVCPSCGRTMVAKCGEVRVWHWAHLGQRMCDVWWENETEWHRAWKSLFPTDWQEVIHQADSGEKHIADVKTIHGWVLEFQHSYLKPEERRARDSFYTKLIWVVDGLRRTRDLSQFTKAWQVGRAVGTGNLIWRVPMDECALLREWVDCRASVLFDFGKERGLWWLLSKHGDYEAHVAKFTHAEFLTLHEREATGKIDEFAKLLQDMPALIAAHYGQQAQLVRQTQNALLLKYHGFQRHLMAKRRRRF